MYFPIIVFSLILLSSLNNKIKAQLTSPDGKIQVAVDVKQGCAYYTIKYEKVEILEPSRLGLVRNDADFVSGLSLTKTSLIEKVSDNYTVFAEKKSHCSYQANKQVFEFKNLIGKKIKIIFQVSNDGVAFRYVFDETGKDVLKISHEATSFNFPDSARAWLHPQEDARTNWCQTAPSYEAHYLQNILVGTDAPYKAGWSFPALFRSVGCWLLISESDIDRNYCGSRLAQVSTGGEYSISFPEPLERTSESGAVDPQFTMPFKSPWRVIMIGKTLAPIVESTLITDLSQPSILADTAWIKPGKASWSWVLMKDDSTIYSVQKRFINYASSMGWRYCLIDALWDKQIGDEKIKEIADYAKTKNVGLILWYNSAGSWNTTDISPRDKMFDSKIRIKEFEKISQWGIKGVKIDFFGGDGLSFMNYYQDILVDAAKYKLLVNFHGATVPRGWTRTYSNLISMEAVRGFEFVSFEQRNADQEPNHCAMLPFARNVVGPMDFTPMCFSEVPRLQRKTTQGFELALSVIFQSGIQHYAETPEGLAKQPVYVIDYIKQLPEKWDDIKFIDGFPGKYIVLARKSGDKWYIAGINGQDQEMEIDLDLSFLNNVKKGLLITDGETNRSFSKKQVQFNKKPFHVLMKAHGGFVIEL